MLRDVSLQFHAGEVHALVGENGAGKSTMAKILAGALIPDQGHLSIDGTDLVLQTPGEAQRLGITMIFQEPTLFPDLSVAENIFVERQPRRRARPWLDRGAMLAQTQGASRRCRVVDPRRATGARSFRGGDADGRDRSRHVV